MSDAELAELLAECVRDELAWLGPVLADVCAVDLATLAASGDDAP